MDTFVELAGPVGERNVSEFTERGKMMGQVTLETGNSKRRVEARDGREP